MPAEPLISVIVSTYNQEDTIACALDSILSQKPGVPFEIVMTVDGGSDRTADICREYAERFHDLIRLTVNERNIGIRESYFNAILRCRGKYIADCAGDDYWVDPLKLKKQLDILESDPEITLVHTDWLSEDKLTGKIFRSKACEAKDRFALPLQPGKNLVLPILRRDAPCIIHFCTAMYRRDTVMHAYELHPDLFRNPAYPCEDLQLAVSLASSGKIAYIPEVTLHYRTGGMSDTARNSFANNFDFYFGSLLLNRSLQQYAGLSDAEMRPYHNVAIPYLAAQLFYSGTNSRRNDFLSAIDSVDFHKPLKMRLYLICSRLAAIQRPLSAILRKIKNL